MDTGAFLRRVLPPPGNGWYCWATPAPPNAGYRFNQRFTRQQNMMSSGLAQADVGKQNTYYSMASFVEKGNRRQDNVGALKTFWVDIDCGEAKFKAGKGYLTKQDAAKATAKACQDIGLPLPMMVDSGNGLHCYWTLAEAITADVWRPIAFRMEAAFREHGLIVDPSRTTDHASILRPAGTHNWKDPAHPKAVLVRYDPGTDCALEQIADPVDGYVNERDIHVSIASGGLNSDLDTPQREPSAVPDIVADRCAQMALFRDSGGNVDEPVWRDALAVLKACVGGVEKAHEWSSGHPFYSIKDTNEKLDRAKGPTRCGTFDRDHTGVCNSCPHQGKITSPIQLGEPEPEEVTGEVETLVETTDADAPAVVVDSFAALPASMRMYRWNGKEMSVLRKSEADGVPSWMPFTDAYIRVDHMTDVRGSWVLHLKIRRRVGKWIDIEMPTELVYDRAGMIKLLASKGVGPFTGKLPEMEAYLSRWFDEARARALEARQHQHFGWQTDGGFLVGTRLYKPNAVDEVSLGGDALHHANKFLMDGSAEEWSRIVNTAYAGEGMQQYQFIVANGFGAPLMRLLNVHGLTVNMVSPDSGFGKTTAALCMLAIWGDPELLRMSYASATMNAIYTRLGCMHSLPVYVDEITDAPVKLLGSLAYDVTGGQQKDRVTRAGDAKATKEPWHTLLVTSGNSSMWSRIGSGKEKADAQLLRVLEYRFAQRFVMDTEAARELFMQLYKNHGHPGDVYIRYVMAHVDQVQALVEQIIKRIEKRARIAANERFWSAGIACSLAGIAIAKQLGLVEFDADALMAWCVEQIVEARGEIAGTSNSPIDTFGSMINELQGGFIVTDTAGAAGQPAYVHRRPNGAVCGRVITGENKVWVHTATMRRWCTDNNADFKEIMQAAQGAGYVLDRSVRVALGHGTDVPTSLAACTQLDWSSIQFIAPGARGES